MASYRGHLALAWPLGAVYGGVGYGVLGIDPASCVLAAGATTIGGLLPDLDSDSGKPVREMFGLAAAVVPLMLICRISQLNLTEPQMLLTLAMIYIFIRWGLSDVLRKITVHRGMYHSIPAMLIVGGIAYLGYDNESLVLRAYTAGAVMLGFLSHLVLDEIYAVDFSGLTFRLNQFAGSAVKLYSGSWKGTLTCYALLAGVGFGVVKDLDANLPYGLEAALYGGPPPAEQIVIEGQPALFAQPDLFAPRPGLGAVMGAKAVEGGTRNTPSPPRRFGQQVESQSPRR